MTWPAQLFRTRLISCLEKNSDIVNCIQPAVLAVLATAGRRYCLQNPATCNAPEASVLLLWSLRNRSKKQLIPKGLFSQTKSRVNGCVYLCLKFRFSSRILELSLPDCLPADSTVRALYIVQFFQTAVVYQKLYKIYCNLEPGQYNWSLLGWWLTFSASELRLKVKMASMSPTRKCGMFAGSFFLSRKVENIFVFSWRFSLKGTYEV